VERTPTRPAARHSRRSGARGGAAAPVLLIVTLCFASPLSLLEEAKRVLAPEGELIVVDILRNSPWGRWYLDKKAAGHLFYRHATFYSLEELQGLLVRAGFALAGAASTLAQPPEASLAGEPAYDGIRPGASFVCWRAPRARKISALHAKRQRNFRGSRVQIPSPAPRILRSIKAICTSLDQPILREWACVRLTTAPRVTSGLTLFKGF
jgi:hypothetical protein